MIKDLKSTLDQITLEAVVTPPLTSTEHDLTFLKHMDETLMEFNAKKFVGGLAMGAALGTGVMAPFLHGGHETQTHAATQAATKKAQATQPASTQAATQTAKTIFDDKVSAEFKTKVISIARDLQVDPNHLMAAMAFETGQTFSSSVRNKLSGAIGLIQFMPPTAKALGTSSQELSKMTAEEQLDYVKKYLLPYAGQMKTVEDLYMAILYPAAVAKPNSYVLFKKGSKAYEQNAGLDSNGDGMVTKEEAAHKVKKILTKGMK